MLMSVDSVQRVRIEDLPDAYLWNGVCLFILALGHSHSASWSEDLLVYVSDP